MKMRRIAALLIAALVMIAIGAPFNAVNADASGKCRITETGEEVCENKNADADSGPACVDEETECAYWKEQGECEANPGYMHSACALSCGTCPEPFDLSDEEQKLLELVQEYGVPQKANDASERLATLQRIKETIVYMKNFVHRENPTHTMSKKTIEECRNRDKLCAFWATIGECDVNPSYMATTCAPSCQSCHLIDINARCPIDPNREPALKPGDLNILFDRIVKEAEDGSKGYTVTVFSRPSAESLLDPELSEEKDLQQPPWVITFDNFLTEEESDHLIKMGYKGEYKRSEDVGEENFDGSFKSVVSTGE